MAQIPGGGGGSGTPPDPNSYPVATWRVSADPSETSGLKWRQVKDYLDGTNASQVANAGNAYDQASASLANLAGRLVTHAQLLSENWGGQSASQAIGQFKDLHDAAANAANANWQVGNVLSWYGNEILPWYVQNAPHPGTLGGWYEDVGGDDTNADGAAQQHLARLNDRIVQASNAYPAAVQMKLPPPGTDNQGYGGGGSGGGGAGGGVRGGGIPGGPGGGIPGGGIPGGPGGGIPGGPGGGMPGGGGPGGGIPGGGIPGGGVPGGGHGSLAGYNPPGVPGGGLPGGPGGIPGGGIAGGGIPGGGLAGGGPGAGGLGGGGLGGLPIPGGGVLGGGLDGAGDAGLSGGAGGLAAEEAAARDAAAAEGMAGRGMTGMPMMGGAGGGQGGKERERQTWLTEDEDFWGANEGDLAPPVIG